MHTKGKMITKCKGCGALIFFQDGKPWYARQVPVLQLNQDGSTTQSRAYVSHFVNCPNAADFSGKGKADEKRNHERGNKTQDLQDAAVSPQKGSQTV